MPDELSDFREHLERYRAVTLQALELVADEQLAWRPAASRYSLGQQFLHIAQAEDFHVRGLFTGDWNLDIVRLPRQVTLNELHEYYNDVRQRTLERLDRLTPEEFGEVVTIPDTPGEWTARSWLWFILEHEIHHKGQIWVYLRQLGLTPPFYAMPLPSGERPDIAFREQLGGF